LICSLSSATAFICATKEDSNVVALLKWFKDDFMKWTPKDPLCERCIAADEAHSYNCGIRNNNSSSSTGRSAALAAAPMQAQTIIGNSWKMRKVEIFRCSYR
jgi:hypothetical protein